MKRNIIIIACLSTGFAHGMQTTYLLEITEKSLSMIAHGTPINLIKGSSYHPSNPIDITVVGNHQQNMLQERDDNLNNIGNIYCNNISNSIHERNKDNDSASDDDTYHPHPNQIEKQTWRDFHTIKSLIMHVEEPCISNSTRSQNHVFCPKGFSECINFTIPGQFIDDFVYEVHRPVSNRNDMCYQKMFTGDEAIKEASKDLALCYTLVLNQGTKERFYTNEKSSIALPTLGADVGFPREKAAPIAVATVLEYVKNHPATYESINFFVKKRSDFALYKKLLMQECSIVEKICLLSCAHNDHEHFLAHTPLDVITKILLILHSLQK